MQRVPVQQAEAVPGGDSRRASAHRPGAPVATRARKALSAYQSAATASTPNSPSATSRRDAPARVPSAHGRVQLQQRSGAGRDRAVPLALHRQRRPACPVRPPAPDSVRRMRRRRRYRRKPCRRRAGSDHQPQAAASQRVSSTGRLPSWIRCFWPGRHQNAKATASGGGSASG